MVVLRRETSEAALRHLRKKLWFAQVLLALFTTLVCAAPDLRGLQGFRFGEFETVQPAERQLKHESAALMARALEDVEEFFGDGSPDARIRADKLALQDGSLLRPAAHAGVQLRRHSCAHPSTGPPVA